MRRLTSPLLFMTGLRATQLRSTSTTTGDDRNSALDRAAATAERTAHDAQSMASVVASSSSVQNDRFDSQGSAHDWPEPSLADLDRSIPQVDAKFVADLIRTRNVRRREFLAEQSRIKTKLEEVVRDQNLAKTNEIETALVKELTPAEQEVLSHTRPEYDDGFVIIDCRTVNEVTSWGIIEGAKVLPGHEMFEAFHMTPENFETEFGFPKPRPEETVIFYCQYGARSLMAAQILSWMGYENVLHFRDGYHEWAKQYNLLVRRWMEHDKTSGNNVSRLVAFEAARQLQREIAPEFNALPLQEMQRYMIDETRSPGLLRVGEETRANAIKKLAGIHTDVAVDALPGTVDVGSSTGQGQALLDFMSFATGMEAQSAVPIGTGGTMTIGDVQNAAMEQAEQGRPR